VESEYSTACEPGIPAKSGTKSYGNRSCCIYYNILFQEEFEDTKEEIKIRKSTKNRHHNGQTKKDKRTNNDLRNITHKIMVYTNDVAKIQ
jgi:hypothetical protein